MKSYDTAWAKMLIQDYLASDGFVVSLQNCMNEETIAGIVGCGKTLGCIASSITVNLPAPGHIHRGAGKGGAAHTVFRAGEVHGRITPRAEEICRLVGYSDSAKVTGNLWGERWSKLVANAMGNGLSACTGLTGGEMLQSEPIRRFSTRLGSEAIRVGQAHGYQLEEILHLPPETIARAGEGDEAAMRVCDEQRFKDGQRTSSEQRPSMGQRGGAGLDALARTRGAQPKAGDCCVFCSYGSVPHRPRFEAARLRSGEARSQRRGPS